MILNLLIVLVSLYLLIQIWQTISLFRYQVYSHYKNYVGEKDQLKGKSSDLPEISIWVACRNEEKNIVQCLTSLVNLKYPQDKIQILVGNDQSTDKTKELVLSFIDSYLTDISEYNEKKAQIQLIDIVDNDSGLKAKARVMAQLDKFAIGNYYLITDADIVVNPNWALGLLGSLSSNMGVASGTTMVKSEGIWGWLQEIDWAYFMGLLNLISFSGIPATAVGNNMIMKKEAYWETGGYGKIQFSITEDYKLYSEICKKGWNWNNVMRPEVLAFSDKIDGFVPLLHQRKRWLSGGKELPWYWWLLFGIFGSFYFVTPLLIVFNIQLGLLFWILKFGIQTIQINKIYQLIEQKNPSIPKHILYELYMFLITISTAIFFFLPAKTIWKERKY
jgi:cellulose synthase/poly-beta-1,6-N-acetylglucosamine synthase-like glycosyltransferase